MKTVDQFRKKQIESKEIVKSKQFRCQNWTYWEIQSRNSDTLVKTPKSLHLIPQLTIPERM